MYHILEVGVPSRDNNQIVSQVQNMGPGYDWDAPDSVTNISANTPLALSPNYQTFNLKSDTKLTDTISQSCIYTKGLLASAKFCQNLEGLVIQPHQRFPALVSFQGANWPYYWLHLTEELEDRVDYFKSNFYIERSLKRPTESVTLGSKENLKMTFRNLTDKGNGSLRASRVTFISGTPSYDLFSLLFDNDCFFLTTKLANRLSAARLTGFETYPGATEFIFP